VITQTLIKKVYGPPGTGKTTWLIRDVIRVLENGNYTPENILVCSFSRAAFRTFNARLAEAGVAIPEENLGTLHSLGYRQLLRPELGVTAKWVQEFRKSYGWQLTAKVRSRDPLDPLADEVDDDDNSTDRHYARLNSHRNLMQPLPAEDEFLARFAADWTAFKRQNGLVDFADMIELPLLEQMSPPEGARVLYVDEAQDLNPLQHALRLGKVGVRGADDIDYSPVWQLLPYELSATTTSAAPASSRSAATRSVSAWVLSAAKQRVSVTMPVSRQLSGSGR